jgi:hypothetical protein
MVRGRCLLRWLERIIVQLVEARRLANHRDVAHGRLALILLDSAAETLLSRLADHALLWADMHGDRLKTVERYGGPSDPDGQALVEELEAKSVSDKTRARIRQNYADLVRFVFTRDNCALDAELAGCLDALHRFRNAVYHQDSVRGDILNPANEVYFYLCCQLLGNQKFFLMEIATPPAVVADVFGGQLPDGLTGLLTNDKDVSKAVAEELLAQWRLDHGEIASALASHLVARIDRLERGLEEFIDYLKYPDRARALRAIQLLPYGDQLPERTADFWTRPLPVTPRVIDGWKRRSNGIATGSVEAQNALRQFDEIERALADLEAKLEPFSEAIEREIQLEDDWRRGK